MTDGGSSIGQVQSLLRVQDDLTPGGAADGDPVRELLLRDARLAAAEILTTPTSAAIVAAGVG